MNDIEKLIKLLEHAESFSLEAYGKSPNLSECSLNIQYLRACILQAIGNAKALRERLANDKTDKEIMQQALKALEVLTDNYDDNAVGIEIDAIIALRERLAQPDPLQRLTDVQQEIEAALAPEQKPVACIVKGCRNHRGEGLFIGELCSPCHTFITTGEGKHSQAYRNSQREWQGLTDEEIYECEKVGAIHYQRHKCSVRGQQLTPADDPQWHFAGAIEAKLKEKNT